MRTVPNQPKTPAKAYRLPPELVEKIRREAAERNETMTDVVKRVLEEHFGKEEK